MKRKRELEIVLSCLSEHGITVDKTITVAISDGLKNIRREKYSDNLKRKEKYKEYIKRRYKIKTPRQGEDTP